MKYRMLTDEELQPLEADLTAFLIVNGIYAEEWAKMNADEPEKARAIVGSFSDAVLQIVYEKLEYLEFRSPESCMVFHCGKESIDLISLTCKSGAHPDLSTVESVHIALQKHADQLSWFQTSRAYTQDRETEIHKMLEQGCYISSVDFWNALKEVVD